MISHRYPFPARSLPFFWTLLLVLPVWSVTAQENDLASIRMLRLEGRLPEADSVAQVRLGSSNSPHEQVRLHIELAKIADRVGLHQNTRPVAAAAEHIRAAEDIAGGAGVAAQAAVELAWAEHHYRAEMTGRSFPTATGYANRAAEMMAELHDLHGEAEAVHRLGLIAMQRRELEAARELFDRSLELDIAGGERTFFRGEYERHIGYVDLLEGNTEAAIPHFARSLAARREVGAIDASLFAATTLASALVDVDRFDESMPHILYALTTAAALNSPVGQARAWFVLARLHEDRGDAEAARMAYGRTIEIAESVAYGSVVELASQAINELRSD